jgi:hypothetical protein
MKLFQRISAWSFRHPSLSAFLFGAIIGFLASSLYIICGGDVFLFVPTWASVVFFPGLLVGNWAYRAFDFLGFTGAIIAGMLAVMLSYGLLAFCVRQLLNIRIRRSDNSPDVGA